MKQSMMIILGVLTFVVLGKAQLPDHVQRPDKQFVRQEIERYKNLFLRRASEVTSGQHIDVTYYNLNLRIFTTSQYLRGDVTVKAFSTQDGVSQITLDLMNSMTIDSVKVGDTPTSFLQHYSTFDVTLDRSYNAGELITVKIFYRGVPGSSGFGSYAFTSHSSTPWVWTLSEPYGAKDWWPCKDHPIDKADSADIIVTCDSAFRVGSNGKLVSVTDNGDGTKTHQWQERYPISSYLISVAITNYAQFSNWFKYSPTDSMEVLNYALPEDLSYATWGAPFAVDGLQIFSNLFGLYPFINEKYGHSEFGWGGAMEHQTMTSTCCFSEDILIHELSHQWFGDMITCQTWPDIWLNEGFATYCEALYFEAKYGPSWYWSFANGDMSNAKNAVGTVHVQDSSNVGYLFDGSLVYSKGAVVLHMLRHVLGDTVFFHAMYNYANNPELRFSTASTADFKAVCESTSGKSLSYFFNEWVFGENYPRYSYTSSSIPSSGGYLVSLALNQSTGTSNPTHFIMPLDLQLSAPGWDTTVTIFNDSLSQSFSWVVSHNPSSIQLDPAGWVLKGIISPLSVSPSRLFVGVVPIGSSKTDSVSMTNQSTGPLTISSATSDLSEFTVTPTSATIGPSATQKFYVTFTPTVVGVKSGHITFTHTASGSPTSIAVVGAGIMPTFGYSVSRLWNLVSIPLTGADVRKSMLFPTAISAAYRFAGDSGYIACDSLSGGNGYWLKFGSSQQISITGFLCTADTFEVNAGWNLIGSISSPVTVSSIGSSPGGIITSLFYGYASGYGTTDSIQPGKGYWVKVNQSGKLILASSGIIPPTSLIRLVSSEELPPLPPDGEMNSNNPIIPSEFSLGQNYPNPFNPSTVIDYQLPIDNFIALKVYTIVGQQVATLVQARQSAGYHSVVWDASNMPSGVYYYRMEAGPFLQARKMLLMK